MIFLNTALKVSHFGDFSGPCFPALGLNAEICKISLDIKSDCGKIRARKNSEIYTFHAVGQELMFKL